jgi:proline iminopeptidase
MLDVGDGNHIAYEVHGNPNGKPVVVVHGGPGSGSSAGHLKYFDPARFRVVRYDQRGCGASVPNAGDPATDMRHNTTHHLIADLERLREHLGIDRWLMYGGSWGSTLILAYAERHPDRVSEIVIVDVTMTRREDVDWLYGGVGRFFPAEWARFRQGSGTDARRGRDLVAAYAALVEHPDPAVRERATTDWVTWEDAVISLEVNGTPNAYSNRSSDDRRALVRICAHYFANGAWLEEGEILRDAHRLAGIPATLIHGRLDLGGPLGVAWELAQVWPDADLVVVEDSGHTGSDAMRAEIRRAIAKYTPHQPQ